VGGEALSSLPGDPPTDLGRDDSWSGVRAVVAGFGLDGAAAVDNLLHLGADVVAVAEHLPAGMQERAELLEVLGARFDVGPGATDTLPEPCDVLVVPADVVPDGALVVAARGRGVPVWSEVELARRLRRPAVPWLVVAGEDTSTAVAMLRAVLHEAGLRSAAADGRTALTEAVMAPEPYDLVVAGVGAAQLRFTEPLAAESAVVLGVPGGLGAVFEGVSRACVYDAADPAAEDLVREADVVEGARAIGLTLATPGVGMLGLVEDLLVDRAFIEERRTTAAELCTLAELGDPEPSVVLAALAAAALARAHGVDRSAVRDGLRAHHGA